MPLFHAHWPVERGRATTRSPERMVVSVSLDLGEDVAHHASAAFDTAISRSRLPSASLESIDFAASVAPSFRSLALPATTSAAAALRWGLCYWNVQL